MNAFAEQRNAFMCKMEALIGLDVHDIGECVKDGNSRKPAAGMVLSTT